MSIDERLGELGDDALAIARRRAAVLEPPESAPGRLVAVAGLLAVVVIVAAVGLAVRSSDGAPGTVEASSFEPIPERPGDFAARNVGVEFWMPPDPWQVTTRSLTPNLDQAPPDGERWRDTIISFSTFEPVAGSTRCHHLPEAALAQIGPTDALVSVLELQPLRSDGLPERRRATGIYADDPGRFYRHAAGSGLGWCADQLNLESAATDIGFSGSYTFRDNGRDFTVTVGLGSDVPAETEAQAWWILQRLEFSAR